MTRMLAPHTTCPGCSEEVFLDELVRGKCPLCGCILEEFEEQRNEMEEYVERGDFSWLVFNYFIFKRFDELGASPLQVMQLIAGLDECCSAIGEGELPKTRFDFELPMKFIDMIKPKKCARCGKIFIIGGRKILSGDLSRPGFGISYLCRCRH